MADSGLSARRYGFDWLRVFVIAMLFPFHTARVFDAWEPNYVKGAVNGFSTWFVASVGYWFMPLLFVVAGYSAYTALFRRTPKQYLKERALRLLVPLLLGLVLIAPPQGYFARLEAGYTGGYFAFLGGYFTDFSDLSGYTGGFSPDHLWFILYLFIISAALLPLLLFLRRRAGFFARLARPWILILGFIPVTAMLALPDFGGKNLFYYAMLFLLGAVLATSESFIGNLRRYRRPLLSGGLLAGGGMLALAATVGWQDGYTPAGIGFALLVQLSAWLIALGLMGVSDVYFNKPSGALSYLSRASYPVYLVHQTLLIGIAYFALKAPLAPAPLFLLIMLGTLAASLGVYEVCRRFGATRVALGIKG
jgi:Acyltransferase family.